MRLFTRHDVGFEQSAPQRGISKMVATLDSELLRLFFLGNMIAMIAIIGLSRQLRKASFISGITSSWK